MNDKESYLRAASSFETHRFLKEKITGLPNVDAVSLVDAEGKTLIFSRSWPSPGFNVSDRDYFKALSATSDIESFIGQPVQSRVDGSQIMFLARRLTDPNGEFLGVILARSSEVYREFPCGSSLGEGSAVSVFRNDGILLASFPFDGPRADQHGRRTCDSRRGRIREPNSSQEMTIRSARALPSSFADHGH